MKKHVAFYHAGPAKTENYKHNSTSDFHIKVEDSEKNTLEENENPLGEGGEEEEKNVEEFSCSYCEKSFKNKKHLSRHQATHSGVTHNCPQCNSTFSRRDKLNAHIRKKHQTETEENKCPDNCVDAEAESADTNDEDQQIEEQERVDFEELLDE